MNKIAKITAALAVILLTSSYGATWNGQRNKSADTGNTRQQYSVNKPAESAPPTQIAPNGQRRSPYPPYTHPTK